MSSATPPRSTVHSPELQTALSALGRQLAAVVRAAAFWLAALLPLAVLAALVVGSLTQSPALLAGVLTLNVVCAVVGHGHSPEQ
ncbi:uncharacterized protein NP_2264A [Natronomonas pharaonis DSM 2160]|uniref:Uncharacterized protein n=1 Tax=Natronomonas pharaonis (strain ATCC 35678 / DSM 2160 / CIP 103997 / JCM 8858 / NBRC 14720 / NCIMB 2260 / Gabara) TaxID=348780 RepID=A0A1U7EVY1_NATPD|nr:hypothetical protein [Natronomonas pharaonis]CAI49223.1 uncharacterized protein NP_2264A [Natronomonas pharaonis DSM 2160]